MNKLRLIFADADGHSTRHFWLKSFGVCALVGVEAALITLLCCRLIGPRPLPALSLLSFGLAIALDLSVLKTYLTIKRRNKSC